MFAGLEVPNGETLPLSEAGMLAVPALGKYPHYVSSDLCMQCPEKNLRCPTRLATSLRTAPGPPQDPRLSHIQEAPQLQRMDNHRAWNGCGLSPRAVTQSNTWSYLKHSFWIKYKCQLARKWQNLTHRLREVERCFQCILQVFTKGQTKSLPIFLVCWCLNCSHVMPKLSATAVNSQQDEGCESKASGQTDKDSLSQK